MWADLAIRSKANTTNKQLILYQSLCECMQVLISLYRFMALQSFKAFSSGFCPKITQTIANSKLIPTHIYLFAYPIST